MPTEHVQNRALIAGLTKFKRFVQRIITWYSGGVATGEAGSVTEVDFSTGLSATQNGNRLTVVATGGGGGSGTVEDVDVSDLLPLFTTVVNDPTQHVDVQFTLVDQDANTVFAGPTTGPDAAPTFRALVDADLPAIAKSKKGPGCIFSNGGLLLFGTLADEIEVPYAFNGTGWTIVGDVAGSASIVVSHATYANYDTMTTTLTATVTTAKKNQATGLTYSFAAGDIVRFSGSGFAGFTRCSIQLDGTPA